MNFFDRHWNLIIPLIHSIALFILNFALLDYSGFFDHPSYLTFVVIYFFSVYGYFGGGLIYKILTEPVNKNSDGNRGDNRDK